MNKDKIDYLGINKIIKRGSGVILEESEKSLFLFDKLCECHILCGDTNECLKWLDKHKDTQKYELFQIFGEDTANAVKEKFDFEHKLKCYQVAYLKGGELSLDNCNLEIVPATENDIEFITTYYRTISEEELRVVIRNGNMFLGKEKGATVGFIGEHLEGSMGLLHILDEYRGKGYGTWLEKYMINYTKAKGWIPYGHVIIDNDKSVGLQNKLGMTILDEYVYWEF